MKRSVKLLLTIFSLLIFFVMLTALFILLERGLSINAIYWILPIIYFIQIVLSFTIFFSKRRYEVKTAWLFMMNIPVIGIVSFFTNGFITIWNKIN